MKRFLILLALALFAQAPAAPATAQAHRAAILSAPVYDASAQAYFDRLKALGCVTPTAGFKAAVNAYVIAEKAALNWSMQDAQYILPAPDACTASVNLAQPSLYQLTFSGSYAISTAGGFVGTSGGYADTGVNQSGLTRMTQNNAHFGVWVLDAGNARILGVEGSQSGILLNLTTNKTTRITGSISVTDAGGGLVGYNWAARTSSSAITTGNNATVQSNAVTSGSSALEASHVVICRSNGLSCGGSPRILFVDFGGALTSNSAHYANVRALLIGVGAPVP